MSRTITNDVPQELLDLAREALELGLTEVELGFGGGQADQPDSPFWFLHLRKREGLRGRDRAEDPEFLSISIGRDEEVNAYVGERSPSNYWDLAEIRDWMRRALPADGEHVPAWAPVLDSATQAQLLGQWPRFQTGALSGWEMTRTVNWADAVQMSAHLGREIAPMTHLRWKALNGFYNMERHPSHRGTGAPLSVSGWTTGVLGGDDIVYRGTDSGPRHERISLEELDELLGSTAPWFVRVSSYDEEREKTIRFPEAKAWKKSKKGMRRAVADDARARAMVAPSA